MRCNSIGHFPYGHVGCKKIGERAPGRSALESTDVLPGEFDILMHRATPTPIKTLAKHCQRQFVVRFHV